MKTRKEFYLFIKKLLKNIRCIFKWAIGKCKNDCEKCGEIKPQNGSISE
jgi:hypothetical protein